MIFTFEAKLAKCNLLQNQVNSFTIQKIRGEPFNASTMMKEISETSTIN